LISRIEKALCISAFVVLVAVLFADVISREATAAGIHWAPQIGVWANVLIVMAGFGLASSSGAHLRPRFADEWLPERWHGVLLRVQHLLMAAFCLAIGSVSFQVVLGSWQLGEVEITLFLPIWPIQAMLPLAFFIGALRHSIFAWKPALRPDETGAFDLPDASISK